MIKPLTRLTDPILLLAGSQFFHFFFSADHCMPHWPSEASETSATMSEPPAGGEHLNNMSGSNNTIQMPNNTINMLAFTEVAPGLGVPVPSTVHVPSVQSENMPSQDQSPLKADVQSPLKSDVQSCHPSSLDLQSPHPHSQDLKSPPDNPNLEPPHVSPDVVNTTKPSTLEGLKIPRDYLPKYAITSQHVGHIHDISTNTDEFFSKKQKMVNIQKEVRSVSRNLMRIAFSQNARKVGMTCSLLEENECVVSLLHVIESWKEDHSDQNAEKLWQALYGLPDMTGNFSRHIEKEVMTRLGLECEDQVGDGKHTNGCVERIVNSEKTEVISCILGPGQRKHGYTVGVKIDKNRKSEVTKGWRRKPGEYHSFFKIHDPSKIKASKGSSTRKRKWSASENNTFDETPNLDENNLDLMNEEIFDDEDMVDVEDVRNGDDLLQGANLTFSPEPAKEIAESEVESNPSFQAVLEQLAAAKARIADMEQHVKEVKRIVIWCEPQHDLFSHFISCLLFLM